MEGVEAEAEAEAQTVSDFPEAHRWCNEPSLPTQPLSRGSTPLIRPRQKDTFNRLSFVKPEMIDRTYDISEMSIMS
jgi:hypothetical protein